MLMQHTTSSLTRNIGPTVTPNDRSCAAAGAASTASAVRVITIQAMSLDSIS